MRKEETHGTLSKETCKGVEDARAERPLARGAGRGQRGCGPRRGRLAAALLLRGRARAAGLGRGRRLVGERGGAAARREEEAEALRVLHDDEAVQRGAVHGPLLGRDDERKVDGGKEVPLERVELGERDACNLCIALVPAPLFVPHPVKKNTSDNNSSNSRREGAANVLAKSS